MDLLNEMERNPLSKNPFFATIIGGQFKDEGQEGIEPGKSNFRFHPLTTFFTVMFGQQPLVAIFARCWEIWSARTIPCNVKVEE